MNPLRIIVLLVLVAKIPLTYGQEISNRQLLNLALENQCEKGHLQAQQAKTEYERVSAESTIKVMCECLPGELEDRVSAFSSVEQASESDLVQMFKSTIISCAAKEFRRHLIEGCPVDLVAENTVSEVDVKPYCECVQSRVNEISDEVIAEDSLLAYKAFKEKATAIAKGSPLPPERESKILGFAKECKPQR